jgi:hypothetical protein
MDAKLTIKYVLANLAAAAGAVLLIIYHASHGRQGRNLPMGPTMAAFSAVGYIWMICSILWHARQKLPGKLRLIGILANAIMLLPAATVVAFALYVIKLAWMDRFH